MIACAQRHPQSPCFVPEFFKRHASKCCCNAITLQALICLTPVKVYESLAQLEASGTAMVGGNLGSRAADITTFASYVNLPACFKTNDINIICVA